MAKKTNSTFQIQTLFVYILHKDNNIYKTTMLGPYQDKTTYIMSYSSFIK